MLSHYVKAAFTLQAYVSLNFGANSRTRFVDDGVDFFDDVKVRLVVRVANSRPSPRYVRQLTCGKRFTHPARNQLFFTS